MKEYFITTKTSKRLDLLLQEQLPVLLDTQISNSKIRRLIIANCVFVENKIIKNPSFLVNKNSKVKILVDIEKLLFEKKCDDIEFTLTDKDVLYEDDYLIFVNKPSNFPTEKTIVESRNNLHDCVVNYLWNKNKSLRNPPYVGIMHRLDKDTSGVILFTKSRTVNKAISEQFDSSKIDLKNYEKSKIHRSIKKSYLCVVKSKNELKQNFTVKNYINRISSKSSSCVWGEVNKNVGLLAITEFTVLKNSRDFYLLEAVPVTGRTHQIRVHLKSLGCPICNDAIYGNFDDSKILKTKSLMLHAYKLEICHPVTNEVLCVTSPIPKSFEI